MRNLILFLLLLISFLPDGSSQSSTNLKLWYNNPSTVWEEALPIGNGRIAAMVFGTPDMERLQLNESSVWSGGPSRNDNPNALAAFPQIREYIFNDQFALAHNLINSKVMATTLNGAQYQTVGNLYLRFPGHENYSNYYRELNIENAVASCKYTVDGVEYQREVISSVPDQIIALRLTASEAGKISFSTTFGGTLVKSVTTSGSDKLIVKGISGNYSNITGQVKFDAHIKIVNVGGTVSASGDSLIVSDADAATIYISMATNFVNYLTLTDDPEVKADNYLDNALLKDFETLKSDHIAAYQNYFKRVNLDLGTSDAVNLPTDSRIKNFASGNDPQLVSLYFQFGRYLLISSSQPGGQPANLQGIWNDKTSPPWGSKYTIDINTEMNYWPSEVTNLTEMHEPLVQMVKELSVAGHQTAQTMYGANGWVTHHNTDIWRMCGSIDGAFYGMWPMGGAWLSQHLWEKYMFSGDTAYLESVYPVLKGACEFFVSTLVHESDSNWLVVCPSMSPENAPYTHPNYSITAGTTMDNQLVFDLFTKTMAAAKILNTDSAFCVQLKETLDQMPPMQIGKYSQLQEWLEDLDNPSDKHRHVSHLYGAFPSNQISPLHTPELMDAARTSLIYRGDASTGWSMGWKLNLWARFLDGNHAYKMLLDQIKPVTGLGESGGTYPNLFDAHPPFQIDGNFGCTSGISEMLLQSQDGEIHILPAIPDNWKEGSYSGLRARGGFEVACNWSNGSATKIVVKSNLGGNCRIRVKKPMGLEGEGTMVLAAGDNANPFYQIPKLKSPNISAQAHLKAVVINDTIVYDLATEPGKTYTLVSVGPATLQMAKIEKPKKIEIGFSEALINQASFTGITVDVNQLANVSVDSIVYNTVNQNLNIYLANEITNDDNVYISYNSGNLQTGYGYNVTGFNREIVENLLPGSHPQLKVAESSINGDYVLLTFNKKMLLPANPGSFFLYNSSLGGLQIGLNGVEISSADSTRIKLITAAKLHADYNYTISCTGNQVFSSDSGSFEGINNIPVVNHSQGLPPVVQSSAIDQFGSSITLTCSKNMLNSLGQLNAFTLKINGVAVKILDVTCSGKTIVLSNSGVIRTGNTVQLSYSGNLITSDDGGELASFTDLTVSNSMPVIPFFTIPGKIESENYVRFYGIQTENTGDAGDGINVSWVDDNDWIEYSADVAETGDYIANFRVASPGGNGKIELHDEAGALLGTIVVPKTGAWQTWTTVNTKVHLTAGKQYLKVKIVTGGLNINWMNFEPWAKPEELVYLSPSNGGSVEGEEAELIWGASPFTASYSVYFDKTNQLNNSSLKETITDTNSLVSGLEHNTTYYWRIDATNSVGTTAGQVWSFTTTASGTNERKDSKNLLTIYPNPVTDGEFLIESELLNGEGVNLSVLDMLGNILIQKAVPEIKLLKVPVNNLNAGVYIVSISTQDKTYNCRLIIK